MSKFPSPLDRWEWAYQQGLDGVALAVLLRVCYRAGGAQGCTESQGSIAKAIGFDRTSVHRAVKRLEAAGVIRIDGKRGRALRIQPEINFPYLEVLHTSTTEAPTHTPPPTNPEVLHTSTGDVAESNTNQKENQEEDAGTPRQHRRLEASMNPLSHHSPPPSRRVAVRPLATATLGADTTAATQGSTTPPGDSPAREAKDAALGARLGTGIRPPKDDEMREGVSVNGTGAGNRNGTGDSFEQVNADSEPVSSAYSKRPAPTGNGKLCSVCYERKHCLDVTLKDGSTVLLCEDCAGPLDPVRIPPQHVGAR